MMNMDHTSEHFLAYAAGIFDGEGCVGIWGNPHVKSRALMLHVHITNTNKEVLDLFAKRFGSTVQLRKPATRKHQAIYRWAINSDHAISFLDQVYQFLVIKKEQVDVAREFQRFINERRPARLAAKRTRRGMLPLPQEEQEMRIMFSDKMKQLKRTGLAS